MCRIYWHLMCMCHLLRLVLVVVTDWRHSVPTLANIYSWGFSPLNMSLLVPILRPWLHLQGHISHPLILSEMTLLISVWVHILDPYMLPAHHVTSIGVDPCSFFVNNDLVPIKTPRILGIFQLFNCSYCLFLKTYIF